MLRRCPWIWPVVLLLGGSCVEIDDQRPPGPELPAAGQVDTGWAPDAISADLPPSAPCGADLDCAAWLGEDAPCLRARCLDGYCAAEAIEDATPCSDGDFATHGDACLAGTCVPGPGVCVCAADDECAAFDDGNDCNGRLACDGCSCTAIDTPPGTDCDDLNPATLDDVCIDELTCRGEIPCQCQAADECGNNPCAEYLCYECHCLVYPAVAGLMYSKETFPVGVPDGWVASSDNDAIQWRPDVGGGLRATGPDGTYDHGPAVTELVSPLQALPPGAAVLRATIGLLSAEAGCDDRLEVYVGEVLLDTLCGPTATETRTWPIPVDQAVQLRLRFTSDSDENAAAGAFLGDASWIRVAPSTCGPPPDNPAETVLPGDSTGLQRHPDIATLPGGAGFRAVWEDDDGVWERLLDPEGVPLGGDDPVDPLGATPAAAGDWIVWERAGAIVLRGPESTVVLAAEGARAPAVSLGGLGVAWLADTVVGTALVGRVPPFDAGTPATLVGPDDTLSDPRITVHDDAPRVIASTADGVMLLGPGDPGDAQLLSQEPSTSRPDLASGHGRLLSVWTTSGSVLAHGGTDTLPIEAPNARDPAVAASVSGWFVVWTTQGGADSGLAGALLIADGSLSWPLAKVASYTFDDQEQVRLVPAVEHALAVWRSDWMDGDPSTIALRRLLNAPGP